MAKQVQLDANGYRKFGFIDKLAYAAGDFGCNMSFALKSYLTIFWTQFMGMDSIVMASLLLLVQVWDAINDPVIGALVDNDKRTTYKRGKFLAYIWLGSVGLMFAGAACFIPFKNVAPMVKNILFVAGYIIWDAFYTVANVPYGSMLSLISADPGERAELSTWRSVGSMVGGMGCSILIPMLVYDADNNLKGEVIFWMALLMGFLGFLAFQFMIRNTVIRVQTEVKVGEEAEKFNVVKACLNFCRNRAAIGATLAPVGTFIGMYGASTASTIMFQAYFKNAQISGLLSMASYFGLFLWMPFIGKLAAKFGKKEVICAGLLWSFSCYLIAFFLPIPGNNTGVMMWAVLQFMVALGAGIGSCLGWSMMADAMDWEEYKFGSRNEGTTYALHSFFRKLAQGIGPSLILIVMVALGYVGENEGNQLWEVAVNMRYLVAATFLFSALLQFVGLALVYNLDKKTLAQMNKELGRNVEEAPAAVTEESAN